MLNFCIMFQLVSQNVLSSPCHAVRAILVHVILHPNTLRCCLVVSCTILLILERFKFPATLRRTSATCFDIFDNLKKHVQVVNFISISLLLHSRTHVDGIKA